MEAVQKAVVSELLNDIINYLEMDFATYVDLIETLVNTANVAKTKTSDYEGLDEDYTALLNNYNAQRKMIKELKAELAAKDANGKSKKKPLKINGVVCSKQGLVAYNRFTSNYPSSSTINHLNVKDGLFY